MKKTHKRLLATVLLLAAALALAAVLALHAATRLLKEKVEQALGPDSEVAEIAVGWSAVELRGLRVKAPKDWPAQDALRAERILVSPDLLGLFSARLRIARITVDQAYLSVLRTRDGKLRLLPSLLERPAGRADAGAGNGSLPAFGIGSIELRHGVLDFYDATVRTPPYRTRLEQLHARIDDLQFPQLQSRSSIQMDGAVKGVRRDGRLSVTGWAELGRRNSEIATKLQGVDLVALQPYLVKAAETGVKRGTLDLTLKSAVHDNRLRAPGSLTLSDLELASAGGSFMGLPRQAVVAALKDRKGKISIDFILEGNLNDPSFSLNDSIAKRIGAAVAETLGLSLEGLGRGVGGAVEGLGGVMKKLFGK